MTNPWLIVGLGNLPLPNTRHNAGMMFIDYIQKLDAAPSFKSTSFGIVSNTRWNQTCVYLLKPNLLMNVSGPCVKNALVHYKIPIKRLLIVQDDMDKSLGKMSRKDKGSACGHNGIKSLVQCLGTSEFIRLKIGIGRPKSRDPEIVSRFVLSRFTGMELSALEQDVFPRAYEYIKENIFTVKD